MEIEMDLTLTVPSASSVIPILEPECRLAGRYEHQLECDLSRAGGSDDP
jgi:hypothetical protein